MDHDQQIDAMFEANSKSVGVAYLLWFFFGLLGVHRFYAGKTKSAVVRLLLSLSVVGLAISALLWIIDLFLIPSMIGQENLKTLKLLNAGAAQGPPDLPDEIELDPDAATLDPKREAMLKDLRETGYRKERRSDWSAFR